MRTIYLKKNVPKILLVQALRPLWPGVVYSRLSPTGLHDLPSGPLPGPRWVRVRNRLSGICASDLHLLFGQTSPRMSLAALPGPERLYLGHEVVGEVTEVGAGVTRLQVGERVILDAPGANCHNLGLDPPCRHCAAGNRALCENAGQAMEAGGTGGGWGEELVAPETGLYRVPDELEDEAAMMVEPLSVGVRAALRRLPRPGERALVVGCGTIGLATVQALRALSPESQVTALARHPHQAQMARALGASEVLAGSEAPYAAVARLTESRLHTGFFSTQTILGGFDVVYDCVGTQHTLRDSLRWARAGGTVVLAGVRLAPLHVDLTPLWHQEVNLVGLLGHGMETWNGRRRSTYDLTVELLLRGKLTSEGFVTHRFPLAEWRGAARTAADKRSGAIKIALDCQTE